MRERTINDLEDKINEITSDLKWSYLLHASTDATLNQAKEEYGEVFDQKEALMLDVINKGKQIEQL